MAVLERKSTAKLTELLQIEQKVQRKWEEEKIFEEDAPLPGSKQASYEISPFFFYDLIQITKVCCEVRVCHDPDLRPMTRVKETSLSFIVNCSKKFCRAYESLQFTHTFGFQRLIFHAHKALCLINPLA